MNSRIVSKSYSVKYPKAIKLLKGTKVRIRKEEDNPKWVGWLWCESEDGQAGWISKDYLGTKGGTVVLLRDYDAKEVSVTEGEFVDVLKDEFGWAWVRKSDGDEGWIPLENLSN